MKNFGKMMIILLSIGTVVLLSIKLYNFFHTDFVGHNDPSAVAASKKRFDDILLSAEYRNGADHCSIDLLDSCTININVGDKFGGVVIEPRYHLSGDTIIVEDLAQVDKYMNSDRLLIRGNNIYYLLNDNKQFDTAKIMTVKFNILKP